MTQDEKKKIYSALAAPFPEHCIQRTDGAVTGRGYSTSGIGYQYVVNRSNEVVGLGNWRTHREISVREISTAKGRPAFEATCDIIIELGQWVDGTFVVWAEALADGGHTATSLADAKKGSFTNSLKKAAALFGCGRQAYEGSLDDDNLPGEVGPDGVTVSTLPTQRPVAQPVPSAAVPQAQPHQPVTLQARPQQTPSRNRLTSKQLSAIWAIGRKLGMDQAGLRAATKQRFNSQPEFLSRSQASELIGALSQQAGNGHGPEQHEPGQEG